MEIFLKHWYLSQKPSEAKKNLQMISLGPDSPSLAPETKSCPVLPWRHTLQFSEAWELRCRREGRFPGATDRSRVSRIPVQKTRALNSGRLSILSSLTLCLPLTEAPPKSQGPGLSAEEHPAHHSPSSQLSIKLLTHRNPLIP